MGRGGAVLQGGRKASNFRTMALVPSLLFLLAAGPRQFLSSPARDADFVADLPMWGTPPTDTFSGFLSADAVEPGTRLHYHFIASSNGADPVETPVVLWMNGGPGSSSYLGLLQELGPLMINATGGLFENPYAWTTRAHLLVLESPAGVGYSYCAAQLRGEGCTNTDKSTARAARAAVVDFYTRLFSELRKTDLFLTGESYAGVYVPTLAREILLHAERVVPLAGLAVGDPCTDNSCQADSMDMIWCARAVDWNGQRRAAHSPPRPAALTVPPAGRRGLRLAGTRTSTGSSPTSSSSSSGARAGSACPRGTRPAAGRGAR